MYSFRVLTRRFWAHALHDESLHSFIDSYLQHAPRPYDLVKLHDVLSETELAVSRLVFMIFLRMATNKESETCFIEASAYAVIVYDNWLFDATKFFDLCAIFGASNKKLLSKMIANVIKLQPKYLDDIREATFSINKILHQIFEQHVDESHTHTLSQTLLDTGKSLFYFFSCIPVALSAFHESHFLISLAQFYDMIAPKLSAGPSDVVMQRGLFSLLEAAALLVEHGSKLDAQSELQSLTELLDFPFFLKDYCGCFPLAPRLQALRARASHLDPMCLEHIRAAVARLDGACHMPDAAAPKVVPAPAQPSAPAGAAAFPLGAASANDDVSV